MPDSIIMLGGGGHALVVAEAANLAGLRVVGLYDDHPEPVAARLLGITRLGSFDDALTSHSPVPFLLAVGHLPLRRSLLDRIHQHGGRPEATPIVHPKAIVHDSATIGRGVYIGPGAIVHSFAVIESHAIINSGAIVEHECHIGVNAHIAPGTVLGGRVMVGRDALIGLGSRVLPKASIGAESTVGAGSVVLREIAAGTTVAGTPARPIPVNGPQAPGRSSLAARVGT